MPDFKEIDEARRLLGLSVRPNKRPLIRRISKQVPNVELEG